MISLYFFSKYKEIAPAAKNEIIEILDTALDNNQNPINETIEKNIFDFLSLKTKNPQIKTGNVKAK